MIAHSSGFFRCLHCAGTGPAGPVKDHAGTRETVAGREAHWAVAAIARPVVSTPTLYFRGGAGRACELKRDLVAIDLGVYDAHAARRIPRFDGGTRGLNFNAIAYTQRQLRALQWLSVEQDMYVALAGLEFDCGAPSID